MKAWVKRNFYRLYYYNKNVKIGRKSLLDTKNKFEGFNSIGKNCEIASCKIGLGSYISDSSVIKNVTMGKFCSIGSNVQTYIGLHPAKTFASTHPAFFSTKKAAGFTFANETIFDQHAFVDTEKRYVVEIGNDVWIGNSVIIMDGLKIGDGAIIAAGSIVTKDVLPYTVVGGIPAKFMRLRFTAGQIEKMLAIKWWDWDFKKIQQSSARFNNIETFIALATEENKNIE